MDSRDSQQLSTSWRVGFNAAPLRRGFITPFFLTISQNSKSKENWIWRAPVPAIGCLNPGIGVNPEPNTGLICETFALLNRLKNSATTSSRFTPPNGKYFRTRKSIVASVDVFREFLPSPNGLAERGKA